MNEDQRITKDRLTVTTLEAAVLLASEEGRQLLRPFMVRECKLSEVATELGMRLSTLSHRLKRFLDAGLIEIIRFEKRKGRAVKIYRASARQYRIPFGLTPADSLQSLLASMMDPVATLLYRNLARSLRRHEHALELYLTLDPNQERLMYGITAPGMDRQQFSDLLLQIEEPAVLLHAGTNLVLDFEEAKSLQRSLFEITKRSKQKDAGQRYVFFFGMAPLESGLIPT